MSLPFFLFAAAAQCIALSTSPLSTGVFKYAFKGSRAANMIITVLGQLGLERCVHIFNRKGEIRAQKHPYLLDTGLFWLSVGFCSLEETDGKEIIRMRDMFSPNGLIHQIKQ